MSVSIPSGGWASVASPDSTTATQSLLVPSVAQAGDVLFIAAIAERTEIPTVRLNNATTGLTIGRSESSTNISTVLAWKRLTTSDLNGTVAIVNTSTHRQALGVVILRGSLDPVFTNHALSGQDAVTTAKTPPAYTPTANNSVVISAWGIAHVISPYTGYTFSGSSPWVERVETSAQYASNINPTVYLASNLLGASTGSVAQTNITLTSTTASWDSMTSTVVFGPSAAVNPVARASVIQPIAEINATGSTASSGGALTYSIAPSVGVSQPDPGIFLVPYTNSPQTFTVTVAEAGGGSSTVVATVPAAPSAGTISNTTGVETVHYHAGAWV